MTWTLGRPGCVVSDSPIIGGRFELDADAVTYYGGHLVCESVPRDDVARLISTAPDGLDLAKRLVEHFGPDEIDPLLTSDIALRDMARALITKAEGGQPS